MIEICAVGGYNEIGRNMTAVKVGDEVVIVDMGLHVEKYTAYSGDEDINKLHLSELTKMGAIPDDSVIKDWKSKVKAIIITHAHLDHLGAVPVMSNSYNAQIIATPYTVEVLKEMLKDQKVSLKNQIKILNPNSRMRISKNIELEFISATHSTPQTVMVALHTKEGTVVYANDYKFDNSPVLGKPTNTKRLKELGRTGKVAALIMDCTRAREPGKTPSESVAKEMLKDVLLGTENHDSLIIVSTFSSHIARLSSIIELGKKLNRKIVFLGRNLAKYTEAAEKIKLVNFSKDVHIVKYGQDARKELKKIDTYNRRKYLLVMTGHQGEPNSVLAKIASGEMPFKFVRDDEVVFSCKVIPTTINIANRELLEYKLAEKGARIFKDIHVSGHASKEDQRDLITMLRPKHIIPAHGDINMTSALSELASSMGYTAMKNIHLMQNGQKVSF